MHRPTRFGCSRAELLKALQAGKLTMADLRSISVVGAGRLQQPMKDKSLKRSLLTAR